MSMLTRGQTKSFVQSINARSVLFPDSCRHKAISNVWFFPLGPADVFGLLVGDPCNTGFSFRSSSVSAKRKIQRAKANAPERFDDESSCSESESSDDDYEESEYSDDVPDGNSDWDDDSPLHPSDIADDSGSERCCTPPDSQTQYSDESD